MARGNAVVTEGGFAFHPHANGLEVRQKNEVLGVIRTAYEPKNGRHCFYLEQDKSKTPRTYRGRILAAQALLTLKNLVKTADKADLATIILMAWDATPPRASANAVARAAKKSSPQKKAAKPKAAKKTAPAE